MAFQPVSVVYTAAGGLILLSGIKGDTMADTVKALLSGNLTLSNTEQITAKNASSSPSSTPSGGGVGTIPNGAASSMVSYMMAQRGKPYTQNIPGRFGPNGFDCSGLVWAAANHAGVNLPGGPKDDAAAIVDPELQWFGQQAGSKAYTESSQIQAGDVLGFWAPDATTLGTTKLNPDGTMTVGSLKVKSCGHIGMAINPLQYISAYDTASGILVNPIAGDQFVVGVRFP
jgi:cell wall-associated NlpC family hydrolase